MPKNKLNQARQFMVAGSCMVTAFLVAISVIIPLLIQRLDTKRYDLTPSVSHLIGPVNKELLSKLILDDKTKLYNFNANYQPESNSVGVKAGQYKATLATGEDHSITVNDPASNITIKFIPKFNTNDGKEVDGHIIYPAINSSAQVVYSLKSNGLKEDIIVPYYQGDKQLFSYDLVLPSGTEARLEQDGSIGVYSADSTLFGNISAGTEADQKKLDLVRQKSAKTNLVFSIPAPIIKDKNGKIYSDKASFYLGKAENKTDKNNKSFSTQPPSAVTSATSNHYSLNVTAKQLKNLQYPISIDPSVKVSSASDFQTTNSDGGVDIDSVNNTIRRAPLTGGTVQAFGNAENHNLATARSSQGVTLYNNCLVAISGNGSSGYLASVEYSKLASDGTIGTWSTSSYAVPFPHVDGAAVAYNGYLYIIEGNNGGQNSGIATVDYAKLDPNTCDVTSSGWATLANPPQPGGIGSSQGWRAAAYNGYIYLTGGWNGSVLAAYYNTVYFAKVKADGTLVTNLSCASGIPAATATWCQSTTTLPEARHQHGTAIYNGYLYVVGGYQGPSSSPDNAVKYVKIKSDGTLDSTWVNTTGITINGSATNKTDMSISASAGYMYVSGGNNGTASNDVQFAPIYPNGSIGPWQTTSTLPGSLMGHSSVVSNGQLYTIGGNSGASAVTTVSRARIDTAGVLTNSAWPTSTTLNNTNNTYGRAAVVYNGRIYALGGLHATGPGDKTVEEAVINADGTTGSWTTTGMTAMGTGRFYFGAYAYNGYMYAVGGCTSGTVGLGICGSVVSTGEFAAINTDGTIGSWSALANNFPANRASFGNVVYNGYLYVSGGSDGISTTYTDVLYTQINSSTHDIGTWTTGPTVTGMVAYNQATAYNGYIYIAGGNPGAPISTVWYAALNASSGAPGSFSTTSSMEATHAGFGLAAIKGYIYAWGNQAAGANSAGFARINSDGTLGTWQSTQAENSTSDYSGYATDGNSLRTVNLAGTTQYQFINNGGRGTTGTWSTSGQTQLPAVRGGHIMLINNGYVYVVGGYNAGADIADVSSAPINSDGTVGSWTATQALPATRQAAAGVAYNGYLYIFGGSVSGAISNSSIYAKFGANGTLLSDAGCGTAWCSVTGFNNVRAYHSATTRNGYIYLMGGCGDGFCDASGPFKNDVQYAHLNATGGLANDAGCGTTWCSSTSFNTARANFATVTYNGYLYIAGGCSVIGAFFGCAGSGAVIQSDVQYSKLNNDGSLANDAGCGTTWCSTSRLSQTRQVHSMLAINGYMYLIGGNGLNVATNTVEYASIGSNGVLGVFNLAGTLTNNISPHCDASNGNFYCAGGEDGSGNALATVQIASQQAIPRVGHFSRVFDMDKDVRPTKLIAAGSGLTDAKYSVSYANATNSGLTYDNLATNLSSLLLGTNYSLDPSSPHAPARYHFLFFSLDDTLSSVFPDNPTASSSNALTFNDFDLYFNPNPAKRLRNGKSFVSETLTGIDAQP